MKKPLLVIFFIFGAQSCIGYASTVFPDYGVKQSAYIAEVRRCIGWGYSTTTCYQNAHGLFDAYAHQVAIGCILENANNPKETIELPCGDLEL